MKIKFWCIGIAICICAVAAGAIFHNEKNNRQAPYKVPIPVRKQKKYATDAITVPSDIYKLDDFSIAMSDLNRLEKYIKDKNWKRAMKRDDSFLLVWGRLSNQQRDYLKHRLLDLAEPVFRHEDPLVAMRICSSACLQPSHSPDPLKLANRMADIAQIIIQRLEVSHSYASSNYSHALRYYIQTSSSIMREAKGNPGAKIALRNRLKALKERISNLNKPKWKKGK